MRAYYGIEAHINNILILRKASGLHSSVTGSRAMAIRVQSLDSGLRSMAIRVQRLDKQIVRVKWSVDFPRRGNSAYSEIFHLEGNTFKFKLETNSDPFDTEVWSMYIMESDRVVSNQKFCLTAYVGDGTSEFYMSHIEISSNDDKIWSYPRSTFSESYPSIKVTKKIDFIFVIVNLRNISQIFVNEPDQTPSYSDDRRCLNNLSVSLRKLVDEGSDSDVQLKCGECRIAAHKLILGARSEVFRAMLHSDMQEGRQGVVEIVDMEPKVLEIFVRYLYTGNLPKLTEDTPLSLYKAADKYLVEALRRRCRDFMAGNLTREYALGILSLADAHSDKDLKDKVVSYVLKEKIPSNDDEWSKFCDDHPRLANEVLNRAYKESNCNQ